MNLKNEKGVTGIDISISVVVIFIFVSIIAVILANIKNTSKELDRKSEALYIAINEIENVKNQGFSKFESLNKNSTQDMDGNSLVNQPTGTEGFYKTISVLDYADIEGNEYKIPNLVKKVTVKISYMYNGTEENVELSTILSKEN